jgi:hypothetical protein
MQIPVKVFFFCCFCPLLINAQPKIIGHYSWSEPAGLGVRSLELKADNTFIFQVSGDFGGPSISGGYYFVKQDTLILMHTPIKDPSASYYKVIQKSDTIKPEIGKPRKINLDHVYLFVKVVDNKGTPLDGCTLLLMKGNNILSIQLSDAKGEAQIHTEGKIAESLRIGFMMSSSFVTIDLDDFWGNDVKLKVVLSDSQVSYNQKSYLEKYLIYKKEQVDYLRVIGSKDYTSLRKKNK